MAVTYNKKHHRNPSGLNNKVKWMLSESKWDKNKLSDIFNKVYSENSDSNWPVAYSYALMEIAKVSDFDTSLVEGLSYYIKRNKYDPKINKIIEVKEYILNKTLNNLK